MREKLLVLAKAAPEASRKYEELVCVAGITDKGEWRRVYPVPWEVFWGSSGKKFKKKQWIEYELEGEGPSDYRPESRKIKPASIKVLGEAKFSEIERLLEARLTTIEDLMASGAKNVSLGVVKPEILGFAPMDNAQYRKVLEMGKQTTLEGGKAYRLEPPEYKYQYTFKDVPKEKRPHNMLCEDWELERLYSGCKKRFEDGKYPSMEVVHQKVGEKMFSGERSITKYGHVYFVVGTHFRFGTYLVIGVVYPRKADVE
ncbi:hypothetical protein JW721_05725 [Candidatus Micrarchaeota archaeon]|nr:hypothetical protein [Candidatus Micrarchaeota archaeon]